MREYSAERGWKYPENYVFSSWGRNRVYNWFVNGESSSYGFAFGNYEGFINSGNGGEWYERLRNRVGFIVVNQESPEWERTETIHDELRSDELGAGTDHYRIVWMDNCDSLRVFTLVPGAKVTGPAPANSTVTIDMSAEIGGESQSITMESDIGEHGVYQEILPLPGTCEIDNTRITVSENDVLEGALRSGFKRDGFAYWSFDEGTDEWAYDRVSGHHGRIHGAEWTDGGQSGSTLTFDGQDQTM